MLVAFDLDGTLVDSSADLAASGNALLARYGVAPLATAAVVAMVGDGARELVRRLLAASRLDVPLDEALATFLSLYDERLLNTTRPYDGIVPLLGALRARAARLAVLTNKPGGLSERLLSGLGLREFFDDVIGGDAEFGRKPNPGGLLALLTRASVPASQALMVGDSVNDLRTAQQAGVAACLVRYGFGFAQIPREAFAGATFVVDRPGDIADVVDRLTAS